MVSSSPSSLKSLISYLILVIISAILSFTYYPKYKKGGTEATISWDVSGYYMYLPALFIYKDIKTLAFVDSINRAYNFTPDNQQIHHLPNCKSVFKYSCGMALQYLPFFIIAHAVSKPLGYPADGFSLPYQMAIHLGALCMLMMGIWFLRKLLLRYFKDTTVAIVLAMLMLGTNYLNYAIIDVGMSHAWLFACYCLLMFLSDGFYKQPSLRLAAFIGALLGLMALTRPTEAMALLLFMAWGMRLHFASMLERIKFIQNHFSKYILAATCFFILISLQFIYWKYSTGEWFVYSYGEQEFTWKHPHFMDYVFSYRSGWLIYCPLMILPYVGFLFYQKIKFNWLAIAGFSFVAIWVTSAWDIWWYGGRAMIQASAALMIPLSALVEKVNDKKWPSMLFYPIVLVCIYLNLWWTHGAHKGGYISSTDMTEAYYWRIVGKTNIRERDKKLLDVAEDYEGSLQNMHLLFDKQAGNIDSLEWSTRIDHRLYIQINEQIHHRFPVTFQGLQTKWIRFSANIECVQQNWDPLRMTFMGIRFIQNEQVVKENKILLDRLFYQEPKQVMNVDATLPTVPFDKIDIFFMNGVDNKGAFLIDELKVISFDE